MWELKAKDPTSTALGTQQAFHVRFSLKEIVVFILRLPSSISYTNKASKDIY